MQKVLQSILSLENAASVLICVVCDTAHSNDSISEDERVKGENGGNRRQSYDTQGLPLQGLNGMKASPCCTKQLKMQLIII